MNDLNDRKSGKEEEEEMDCLGAQKESTNNSDDFFPTPNHLHSLSTVHTEKALTKRAK